MNNEKIKNQKEQDMRTKIKLMLGLEKWSVRCERLYNLLQREQLNTSDINIIESSDYHYAERRNRDEDKRYINIGTKMYTRQYIYYVYVEIPKKEGENNVKQE